MIQGSARIVDELNLKICVTRPLIKILAWSISCEARGPVGNVDFQHKILRSSCDKRQVHVKGLWGF